MRATVSVAVLLVTLAGAARADTLEEHGFGLRFAAALNRFSRYPDLAGIGGAGGGSPWSSSPNPASSGMNPSVGTRGFGASAQYAAVFFREGTRVDVGSVSGAFEERVTGAWQASVLGVRTNRAERTDGLTFELEALGADLQWGRKVAPGTSVGFDFNVLDSETRLDLGGVPVAETESTTYAGRLGVLHEFSKRFTAGTSVEFSRAPSDTTQHDFMGLGTGDVREHGTTDTWVTRTGFYAGLTKDLTLYADHTFARFSDGADVLLVHRFAAGLDLTVREGLYARAGAVLDRWDNVSVTAGIGLAPSKSLLIDLSYQYAMFPEIEPEFGRAQVIGIGVTLLF